MGCGGSKEAGESGGSGARVPKSNTAANDDKPIPIKKVRTNFSDIHYDEPSQGRRDTTYAPSEIPEGRQPTEPTTDVGVAALPSPVLEQHEEQQQQQQQQHEAAATLSPPENIGPDGMLSPRTTSANAVPRVPEMELDPASSAKQEG